MAKSGKATKVEKEKKTGGRVIAAPCRGGPYGGGSLNIHCWAHVGQDGVETLRSVPTVIWINRADGELDGCYFLQPDRSYHWNPAIWEAA